MILLYPSSPLSRRKPDEQFAEEVDCVRSAGFGVSLFSLEDFQSGTFAPIPEFDAGAQILYRGWMMTRSEYTSLAAAIEAKGGHAFTDLRAYLDSHHLPNWYSRLKSLTPETRVFPVECDLEAELQALNWPEYFIKDYVKSLKTSLGSIISNPDQARLVANDMLRYRGQIEGGFCVRRVESFLPETERRYFVVNGMPHAPCGDVPQVVIDCTSKLSSRFYSVDVVQRTDGQLRVVEVGDGQVSDLVGWKPKDFAAMLARHFLKPS